MSGEIERREAGHAARIEEASAELERLTAEAEELAAEAEASEGAGVRQGEGPGSELVRAEGAASSPAKAKARMAALRSRVARKREEVLEARRGLERLLEEKLADARRAVEPLEEWARRLQEGIWTVNLYLGSDEEILTLRGGEPAPPDTPVTVRQLVLAMDQECAVAAEDGGIDAVDHERFDEWLLEDPAHVEQVIPEEKAVVALVPRYPENSKDYGDPWKTAAVAEANEQTYFLIRNGEKLFRTSTDFRVGRRLVPARDEFTSFFEREHHGWAGPGEPSARVRRPLQPGTAAWARAEEEADARKRHFMRAALILQGLVDRTTVFHPLPADELGVGFLDERHYFADRVRIVMDAEPALTAAGHEPFRGWQRRLNGELRVGMRLIGAFSGTEWFRANTHSESRYLHGHSRLYPHTAYPPESDVPHQIEDRRPDGGLVIRYERHEDVWVRDDWGYHDVRPAKTRASCTVYPRDRFVLPFDLATVEEMERFLRSRTERHEYLSMFPLLKAAIRAKKAEAAEEAPFRAMLAGVLARENGVDVPEVEADVPDLVAWWKHANRHHRPLVGTEEGNARAVRAVVAEHRRRLGDRRRASSDDPAELALVRGAHPDAVLVARKRDASWVVLVPERDEGDPEGNVFVREVLYGAKAVASAKGRGGDLGDPREDRRWRLVGERHRRFGWRVLFAGERWAGWDTAASAAEYLSDPEREALAAEVLDRADPETRPDSGDAFPKVLAISYMTAGSASKDRYFGVWTLEAPATVEGGPLTGRLKRPSVDYLAYAWRRGRGGTPVLDGRRHAWGIPTRTDGGYPGVVLWTGEEAVHRRESEEARYEEAAERYGKLRARAAAYNRAVENAWEQRAEAEAYRRFLEDYDDPHLWEGHRKSLDLRYPPKLRRYGALSRAVDLLVEDGADLAGLTVAEAVALAAERSLTDPLPPPPEEISDLPFPDLGPAEGPGEGPEGRA